MLTSDQRQQFLRTNWRQQSVVFEQAIDVTDYPVDPLALCKLATSDWVESRLIGADHSLALGPFDFELPTDAAEPLLPEKSMLLVQCLEQHLDQIDALIRAHFDFMPRWQIEDVMASVGDKDATCGAHFDQYDVFLIQHTGTKQWQLDDGGHTEDDLAEDAEIRLLKSFTPTRTFTVNPGDVLYIPPGVGHYGVCPESSITLSVGIRHPTPSELLAEISEFALEQAGPDQPMTTGLYSYSALPASALKDISTQLSEVLNPDLIARWYGSYVTRLREPDLMELYQPEDIPAQSLAEETQELSRSLAVTLPTRLAWSGNGKNVLLFVNGEVTSLPITDQPWVQQLCESRALDVDNANISGNGLACLEVLLQAGAVTHS